jgi:hypothetical protein
MKVIANSQTFPGETEQANAGHYRSAFVAAAKLPCKAYLARHVE